MDFELPGPQDERRQRVRAWLEAHPDPTGRDLAQAGYVVPHWPKPWGLEADPVTQLVIDDELRKAGVSRPVNPIGIGHCGPILVVHGTQEQKDRYLMPMLAAEELWCQLFSEPGAGSDLASVSTRAERQDDVYVVNGQKVWTSLAQDAAYGILLARTAPDAPKHGGLSYFIVGMDAAGIEVRPIIDMTGSHHFNEVFFTDVRVPAENLIGEENNGWAMAKETLANERVSLSRGGLWWGWGPTVHDLVDVVRDAGGAPDPILRDRLVRAWMEGEILRVHGLRTVALAASGRPGPASSVRKALADPHGQTVFDLAKDLAGPEGMLRDAGPMGRDAAWWADGFLFAPALTVGGGTSEILRNIIAERILGLPRDEDPDRGVPWNEARRPV